jgi:hypothetical protein
MNVARLAIMLTLHNVKDIEPDATETSTGIAVSSLGLLPGLVCFVCSAFGSSSFRFCPAGALLLVLITVASTFRPHPDFSGEYSGGG